MSVDVRHQRGVAKGKKIRQKWPDVDNPSGYPRLRIVAKRVGWRKRREKKERKQDEETSNEKKRGEDVAEKWTMHVSQPEEIRRWDPVDATPNPVLKTRSRMTVTNSTPTDSLWRWLDPEPRIQRSFAIISCRLSRKFCAPRSNRLLLASLCIGGESRAFFFLAFINWPGYLLTPIESQGRAFNKAPRYRSFIFYAPFIQSLINLPLYDRSDLINIWRKTFAAILMEPNTGNDCFAHLRRIIN